jgi:hypothetical protein
MPQHNQYIRIRFPILNPRNVPPGYDYSKTPYYYMDPVRNNYAERFRNYFSSWVYK